MKAAIFLIAACLASVGCAQGGGDSNEPPQTSSAPPVNQGNNQPAQQAKDYSKIQCRTVQECSDACDLAFPYVDDNSILTTICKSGIDDLVCTAALHLNQTDNISKNTYCKSLMTTSVIELKSIGSQSCGNSVGCANYCRVAFVPVDQKAIDNPAAAAGSYGGTSWMKAVLANDILKVELSACLAAPANFAIPALP